MIHLQQFLNPENQSPNPITTDSNYHPLISLIIICPAGILKKELDSLATELKSYRERCEIIFVIDQSSVCDPDRHLLGQTEDYRLVNLMLPSGSTAILYDQGILISRGKYIWMTDLQNFPTQIFCKQVLLAAEALEDNHVGVFLNPDDEQQVINLPGINLPWLDMFYKGCTIPFINLLFPREIFEKYGLLDPHFGVADFYQQEYLLRICRFCVLEKISTSVAPKGIIYQTYPALFFHWVAIDRRELLRTPTAYLYSVDDFIQFNHQLPRQLLQQIYIQKIFPYYNLNRSTLNHFVPTLLQSSPTPKANILILKTDYETATDVLFNNIDYYGRGERTFKISYMQSAQWQPSSDFTNDALILYRTATYDCLEAGRALANAGHPVGYALDDDLLHFYELGESFTAFRPGHPAYDTMVETIKMADVVMCAGAYVEKAIQAHNLRTIRFDGSVLPEYLPTTGPRHKPQHIKFGYSGGGYRIKEMQFIWPAIEQICKEYGDKVSFEFWGMNSDNLPSNLPQVTCKPFTINYYSYLNQLANANFNAMLVPHFYDPAPRRGKSPNKVFEAAVAQAVGIYSDVPTYSIVKRFGIGLSVNESPNAWYEAIRNVLDMSDEAYCQMQERALAYVRELYSAPAILPSHEAAYHGLLFHAATRDSRGEDGRPEVMFVFPVIGGTGGGEVVLRRKMELLMHAGIKPVVVIPEWVQNTPDIKRFETYLTNLGLTYETAAFISYVITPSASDNLLPNEQEENSIRELFKRHAIALVHSAGYSPALGKVCSDLNIPHIAANYGVEDRFEWPMGDLPFKYCDLVFSDSQRYAQKWASLFKTQWAVLRDTVPDNFFELGFKRLYHQATPTNRPIRIGMVGSLMRRKCNKEAIQAVIQLIQEGFNIQFILHGSLKADLDYTRECQNLIEQNRCADKIIFRTDFVDDISSVYADFDIVMTVSTHESLPNVIKEGSACGALLVCSHAGGIDELIFDGVNGIFVNDSSPQEIAAGLRRALTISPQCALEIRRNAYHLACQEFHPYKGLADLLTIYNKVLYDSTAAAKRVGPEALNKSSGVKFSPRRLSEADYIIERSTHLPTSPRRMGTFIRHSFTPTRDSWMQMHIFVGTHQRQPQGEFVMRIFTAHHRLLRESIVPMEAVRDNNWVCFDFEVIQNSMNKVFQLEFSVRNPSSTTKISIYEAATPITWIQKALRRLLAIFKFPIYGKRLAFKAVYRNG